MRVEALTNKAAHNAPNVVRTSGYALRPLTSIREVTTIDICRERRDTSEERRCRVRKLAPTAHIFENSSGRSAQQMRNPAHENGPKMRHARNKRNIGPLIRPSGTFSREGRRELA